MRLQPGRSTGVKQAKERRVPMEEQLKQSSRRGFLGAMTALTAASYNRVLGANDRVGVGFIGFGLIGKQHVYNFKTSFPDVNRVAMCDVYKPRVAEGLAYMESPNAKGYSDFRKMYEDKNVDGVVVATPDHIFAARREISDLYMDDKLADYIVEVVHATRAPAEYGLAELEPLIEYGASPRATIYLAVASRAHAYLRGRGYVLPEDVKAIGVDVLRHRVITSYEAEAEDVTADDIVARIFESVDVP